MMDSILTKPHLYAGENEVMLHAFAAGCDRYLEFGLGGSTLLAIASGAKEVVCVDSDPSWISSVIKHPQVSPGVERGDTAILHADIGAVGHWGVPLTPQKSVNFSNYVRVAWQEWARRGTMPDLVYVDGRFRVACALSVIIASADVEIDKKPKVLMHDILPDRPGYFEVLNHFDVIEHYNSLYYLKIKTKINLISVVARFLELQFVYA
jgi:hypothetical protein